MNHNYSLLIKMQTKINKKYNLYFNKNIYINFEKLFIKIEKLLQYFIDNITFDNDYIGYNQYSTKDLNNLNKYYKKINDLLILFKKNNNTIENNIYILKKNYMFFNKFIIFVNKVIKLY